jgi:hypothetical protein
MFKIIQTLWSIRDQQLLRTFLAFIVPSGNTLANTQVVPSTPLWQRCLSFQQTYRDVGYSHLLDLAQQLPLATAPTLTRDDLFHCHPRLLYWMCAIYQWHLQHGSEPYHRHETVANSSVETRTPLIACSSATVDLSVGTKTPTLSMQPEHNVDRPPNHQPPSTLTSKRKRRLRKVIKLDPRSESEPESESETLRDNQQQAVSPITRKRRRTGRLVINSGSESASEAGLTDESVDFMEMTTGDNDQSHSRVNYIGAWFVNDDPTIRLPRIDSSELKVATITTQPVYYHCCWSWHPHHRPQSFIMVYTGMIVELELIDQAPGFGLIEAIRQTSGSDIELSIAWFYDQAEWKQHQHQHDKERPLRRRRCTHSHQSSSALQLTDHRQLIPAACIRHAWTRDEFASLFTCQSMPPGVYAQPYANLMGADVIYWSAVEWSVGVLATKFEERVTTEQVNPLLDCGNGVFKQETWRLWKTMINAFPWSIQSVKQRRVGKCFACKLSRVLNFEIRDQDAHLAGRCGSVCAARIKSVVDLVQRLQAMQSTAQAFVRSPTTAGWARVQLAYRQLQQHRDQVALLATTGG